MASSSSKKVKTWDVSELSDLEEKERANVNVCCMVSNLSPIKSGKSNKRVKYFHGRVTDGKTSMKVVAFEPSLRSSMDLAKSERKTVVLSNCIVKDNVYEEGQKEIVVSGKTKVMPSPKKLKWEVDDTVAMECELTEIEEKEVNSVVVIKGKVLSIGDVIDIKSHKCKDLKKQDCVVSDKSGTCKVVLWEEHVNTLECGVSYELRHVIVKEYDGKKYLTYTDESAVSVIDNMDDVHDVGNSTEVVEIEDEEDEMIYGEIIAVVNSDVTRSCVNCNGDVNAINDVIGRCNRCRCKLKLSKCKEKLFVKYIVEDSNGETVTLCAYNDVVKELKMTSGCPHDKDVAEYLLLLPTMTYVYNQKHTITAVEVHSQK